jgi:hypothetical protein
MYFFYPFLEKINTGNGVIHKVTIFIITIIILFFIIISNIYIKIIFHRLQGDDNIQINAEAVFRLVKFKYSIPYIDFILGKGLKPGIKVRRGFLTKKRTPKTRQAFTLDEIKRTYEKLKTKSPLYKGSIIYFLNRLHVKEVSINTEIGFNDAAYTALSYGLLWNVNSYILGYISSKENIDKIYINIVPNFQKTIFEIDFDCIIRIKVVNIIIAGIRILCRFLSNAILYKGR